MLRNRLFAVLGVLSLAVSASAQAPLAGGTPVGRASLQPVGNGFAPAAPSAGTPVSYLGPDGKPVSTTRPPGEVISMKNLVAPLSTPLPAGLDNPQKNLLELIVDRMKTAVGLSRPPSAALQTNYTPGISRRNRERREESRRRD